MARGSRRNFFKSVGGEAALKISVVTTSFNSGRYLSEAVESVLCQKSSAKDLEHIVADACSTDETADVLLRYPHLHVDVRKDGGIYDGMNRAIRLSSGEVVGILNADDRLADGALSAVESFFSRSDADILTGSFRIIDNKGRMTSKKYKSSRPPTYRSLLFGIPAINARFFRRSVFDQFGFFDCSLGLAADRAWLLQARQRGARFANIPACLYLYRQHKDSATLAGDSQTRRKLYAEHISLANLLQTQATPDLSKALREFRRLEELKLAIGNTCQKCSPLADTKSETPGSVRFIDPVLDPLALSLGIHGWWRWRGRHADS